MIRAALAMLVRALLECAIVFLAVAAVMLVLSFRLGRRLVTDRPDRLDSLSARALQLNALIPRRAQVASLDDDSEAAGGA